jgi:hypothetical protein
MRTQRVIHEPFNPQQRSGAEDDKLEDVSVCGCKVEEILVPAK